MLRSSGAGRAILYEYGVIFLIGIGLVPRQYSSGGKERFGRVSKAGQTDIRRLLIIGAKARVIGRGVRNVAHDNWLGRTMHRKPKMLAAIALAKQNDPPNLSDAYEQRRLSRSGQGDGRVDVMPRR